MKSTSIREYISLYKLNKEEFKSRMWDFYGIKQKDREIIDTFCLFSNISDKLSLDIEGFFFDTQFNIGPDYDILRFTHDRIINIDLKDSLKQVNKDKIIKKFNTQNIILSGLHKKIVDLVYVHENEEYFLYEGKQLIRIDLNLFIEKLAANCRAINDNLVYKIEPSKFLISPTENIDEFIEGKYILNDAQEACKDNLLKNEGVCGVKGEAGTGKTLLAFDIIKELDQYSKVAFIFSGTIRENHQKLVSRFKNIDAYSAKDITSEFNFNSYDTFIVDEAQRLYIENFRLLATYISNHREKKMFFFYSIEQTIRSDTEIGRMISNFCKTNGKELSLKKSVRSNIFIVNFINQLCGIKKDKISGDYLQKYIDVKYFLDVDSAVSWIKMKQNDGYQLITPTGDNYYHASFDKFIGKVNDFKNTHSAIGSEFNKVVTYLDENVDYNDGHLVKRNREVYDLASEAYVNMSRAKNKLAVAVIDNVSLYDYINREILIR